MTELTPNIGKMGARRTTSGRAWATTASRIFEKFVKNGGVYIGAVASSQFAIDDGLTNGVGMNTPARGTVTGTYLRTRIVDDASPIVYGVADGISAYTDGGESFSVSASRIAGGRGGGGGGGGGAAAWTWRWRREPRDGSRHAGRRR